MPKSLLNHFGAVPIHPLSSISALSNLFFTQRSCRGLLIPISRVYRAKTSCIPCKQVKFISNKEKLFSLLLHYLIQVKEKKTETLPGG